MPLSTPTDVRNVLTTSFDGNEATNNISNGKVDLRASVKENPVMVLGRIGCCMCHVVRRLLIGLGVNPAVIELEDNGKNDADIIEELKGVMIISKQNSQGMLQLPAVFIGGRHVGGLDQLIRVHISGELVPILKDAGALWL